MDRRPPRSTTVLGSGPRPATPSIARDATYDGRYRIVSLLGEGGMGHVYEALHLQSGRALALKILQPHLSRNLTSVRRFEREARAVSVLRNRHIVDVLETGHAADGTVYLAMQLLEGEDLEQLLNREGRLPVPRTVRILTQICDGLAAAHGAGIVHRDLKPANVFLTPLPSGDHVTLLDFGLAKFHDPQGAQSELTKTGTILGTAPYMAPEQILSSRRVDQRADLYALGCIAFEMLGGRPPFVGGSAVQLFQAHLREPPPDLRAVRGSDVPAGLERAIRLALAKDATQRIADAAAFAAAIAS